MKHSRIIYGRRIYLLFAALSLCLTANGQIVINEFSASNSTQVEDVDFNDYADWIELYNAGSAPQNLKGFYVTDNFNIPGKWQITIDTVVAAGGYILIWADDNNTGLHTSFKLSAPGEEIGIYSPGLILLDSVSFTELRTDISKGRISDGNAEWGFFQEATPNASNVTVAYSGFVSSIAEFTVRGGFFTGPFSLGLSNIEGEEIRYTTDGSVPDYNSNVYSSALSVNATSIVRARIFKSGWIPGPATTQSYFINENSVDGRLPVVSIASAAENFWDPLVGIYVQDFKPLWEIPVNIELFENDGSDRAAFNESAGAKINGLYAWQLPQKMVGIYFRSQYGSGSLQYPLLRQRTRDSYKSFALRASGSDWSFTLFRDMLAQHSTLFNMDIDIMGFRPALVYVNGEYMGIHNMREKVDDDYIEKSYNIEPGSFDLVENEEYAEAGDLIAYNHLLSLLEQDLSINTNYDAVKEVVDIKNFTDYAITEMATGNTSIDHNVMAWKPKASGKWRWVLMDVDRGFFNPTGNLLDFYISKDQLLLKELLANQSYISYFGQRLAGQLYTSFNPRRMKVLIDYHARDIEAEITRHISRWEGTTSSYGNAIPSEEYWRDEIARVKSFVEARPYALLTDLQSFGFGGISNLTLTTYPENAGTLKLDQLEVPGPYCTGPFLEDIAVQLEASDRPGYEFAGWVKPLKQTFVPRGSVWKYADTGTDPGTGWTGMGYNDASWSSGAAQLGYGDGDENTVVAYGGAADNKYITTYFRNSFSLSEEDRNAHQFLIQLLRDDGAIVYLNGIEIVRSNIPPGEVSYQTTASNSVGGESESVFYSFLLDRNLLRTGENILAVEVHQYEVTSSDISFDFELSGYRSDNQSIISGNRVYSLTLKEDLWLTALYTATSSCVIPDTISGEMTLSADCTPYLARGDVTIGNDAILTIEPGVEIWMPEGANMIILGVVHANGTPEKEIRIKLNPDSGSGSWGGMFFHNTPRESILNYMSIEDASRGPDPVIQNAAISAFHADLVLDHLTIEQVYGNPITARYSDITLTNSSLHSIVTGDLINVKYGMARIENCLFVGNDQPDTDAIDYDEIENGIIRNCQIRDFLGLNSDAIDIGEKATNILIDSIVVCNITDKGVSVGQGSSALVRKSIFIHCNRGVAVKDSGQVIINSCIFYGNQDAVASFEKNLGFAGGNAMIRNSILSNSSHASIYTDSKSTMDIQYSLADNTVLPAQSNNIFANPSFAGPSFYNFDLLPGSPAMLAGYQDGTSVDMGVRLSTGDLEPSVMIYQLFLNSGNLDLPEFIGLYNPSSIRTDLSDYSFTKGITATIPPGTYLDPGEILYLTDDVSASGWWSQSSRVIQWESGKLSNSGEALQLEENHGIVIDFLEYENNGLWPGEGFSDVGVFQLIDPGLDNHFPESWTIEPIGSIVSGKPLTGENDFTMFPNPTSDRLTVMAPNHKGEYVGICNLNGQLLGRERLNEEGTLSIDLSLYPAGILILKVGSKTGKVVLLRTD